MKKAFTLAEVLITLMIIGIVAALTIPSVISNYQQQEFKTGLKKAVSVLNEAIQTNIASDGETPYDNEDLFNYLQKHMSVLKVGKRIDRCYGPNGSLVSGIQTGNSCSSDSDNWLSGPDRNQVFYTTDGMRFEVNEGISGNKKANLKLHESGINLYSLGDKVPWNSKQQKCGSYGLSSNPNNTKTPPCVVLVDINGDKKPNPETPYVDEGSYALANLTFEYKYPSPTDKKLTDIFNIMITEDRAIPFGVVAQRAMYSK